MTGISKPDSVQALLASLLPESVHLTNDDWCYLTGASEQDLMALVFPSAERITRHTIYDEMWASEVNRPVFAISKTSGDRLFTLSSRIPGGEEHCLLDIPTELIGQAKATLSSGDADQWRWFVQKLPPSSLIGWYPNRKQGLAALERQQADGVAITKTLEALALQAQLFRNISETIIGLAGRLTTMTPDGGLKLADLLNLKNLTHAGEEARYALSDQTKPDRHGSTTPQGRADAA